MEMINDNLPAVRRAINTFSEEYRPNISALFLHRTMDRRIRDNVKLYDSITSGNGIEFPTKSAANRDVLREFSVIGNFLEKGKQPIPTFYAVLEDGIGLTPLEAMSLMRLLCHCHQNMPRAIRVPTSAVVPMDRVVSVEQFKKTMSKYLAFAVYWTKSLFSLANVHNTNEKMAVVKNSFAAFGVLQMASSTAALIRQEQDALCLWNGTLVPRNVPQHLKDKK